MSDFEDNPLYGIKSNMPIFGKRSNKLLYGTAYQDLYISCYDIAESWKSCDIYTREDGTLSIGEYREDWGLLWAHHNAARGMSRYLKIEIVLKDCIVNIPYAKEATLYFPIRATRDASLTDNGLTKDMVFPIHCIISNGDISIPKDSFENIARAACNEVGATFTTGPDYLTSRGGLVEIVGSQIATLHLRVKVR